jgi:hypothetical protein
VGVISPAEDISRFSPTTEAKGVRGGAVALVGEYAD